MKFNTLVFLLSFLIFSLACGCDRKEEQSQANTSRNVDTAFPCWEQSWQCGKWFPLTHKLDHAKVLEGETPDGKLLFLSTCDLCDSIRLVNPEAMTERILLSPKGRAEECKHTWSSSVHNHSFDPIKKGDAIFVAFGKEMYVLLVESIFFPSNKISCKIAKITSTGEFVRRIRLGELTWKRIEAEDNVAVGSRWLPFYNSSLIDSNDNVEYFLSITYDRYYGSLGGASAWRYDPSSRICIVHKSYLESNSEVDLAEFRFKMWEDGLGNRCEDSHTN